MDACSRLEEERERLGLTRAGVAEELGVDRTTVQRWEKAIAVPADKLGALARMGFDAQYVVTGVRSENARRIADERVSYEVEPVLSRDELRLLRRFRELSEPGRAQALKMLDVIEMGAGASSTTISVRDAGAGAKIAGRDVVERTPRKRR